MVSFYQLNNLWYSNRLTLLFCTLNKKEVIMSQPSKIAELGILNILNQMKNPLTNIRLCVDMLGDNNCVEDNNCREIIKNSAINLENSIRDLCTSFADLGVTIHLESEKTQFETLGVD